jgi:copper chaperone
MQQTTFGVTGMTCGGCVKSVTRTLQSVPGVTDVQVSLEDNIATVQFDESHSTQDALHQAVRNAGYGVTETAPVTTARGRPSGGCCS